MTGRSKNTLQAPALEPHDPQGRADKESRQEAAQEAHALALVQQNQRVSELARQLNYNGPTDPGVLENSARDVIRRIGAGIFELGAYLLLLKEACEYGKFLPTLERLSLGVDAAQRYMAITRRFSNAATSRHLEAAGMSKLVELLPLDDEQLEDLTELGRTGELALDDVVRMSVKELRAAVRKARDLVEKRNTEIERLHAVNDELQDEARRIKRAKPDQAQAALHAEAATVLNETLGYVRGALRQALLALAGERGANTVLMAGMVGQVQAELLALRDEFNLTDIVGDGRPEWQQWAEAQGAAASDLAAAPAPAPTLPQRGRGK